MALFICETHEMKELAKTIRAGDRVRLSGTVYTARDAAHRRLTLLLDRGEPLPFPFKGAVIYYTGPTPAAPGQMVGSCGPTTSGRMDKYAPRFMEQGMAAMIGKGPRSAEVRLAMQKWGVLYFAAMGGAGAMIADSVKSAETVAFPDLGCESVKRLSVYNLPLVCACDAGGGDLYAAGRETYRI